jgi:hypothetical protein
MRKNFLGVRDEKIREMGNNHAITFHPTLKGLPQLKF